MNKVSITLDQFKKAFANNNYPVAGGKYNDFIKACEHANIKENSEAAMFLAQLFHESDGLRVTEETYTVEQSKKLYGDYIGRGYIQLSSQANYRAAGLALDQKYEKNPKIVSQDPHAWWVSAWYWKNEVHQHVKNGFQATTTNGLRPAEPNHERRGQIYENVKKAFGL